MGELIRLKKGPTRLVESEETKLDEQFDAIIEKNKRVKEKLAKERAEANKKTLRRYRIKK